MGCGEGANFTSSGGDAAFVSSDAAGIGDSRILDLRVGVANVKRIGSGTPRFAGGKMMSSAGSENRLEDRASSVPLLASAGIFAYLLLGTQALALYHFWLPGVPDAGMVPLSMLPSLLFFFLPYLDPIIFVTWLVACSVFLIPPAMMAFFAASLQARLLSSGVVLLANVYGSWEIWTSRMIYFHARPYSFEAGLATLARDSSFILLLSVVGLLLGHWARRHRTAAATAAATVAADAADRSPGIGGRRTR